MHIMLLSNVVADRTVSWAGIKMWSTSVVSRCITNAQKIALRMCGMKVEDVVIVGTDHIMVTSYYDQLVHIHTDLLWKSPYTYD